jgi:peptidoglycan/LPS O-acetylase OafA/YrhL
MRMTESAKPAQDGGMFLPKLESVRGFAALAVAYSHCGIALIFAARAQHGEAYRRFSAAILRPLGWIANGEAAVIVFFVLSGLVLSLTLDQRPAHRSLAGFGDFVRRRVLRIYPAHVAALLLFIPLAGLTIYRLPLIDPQGVHAAAIGNQFWIEDTIFGHFHRRELVKTAALVSNYYNPVTWTLQVEMLASLLLPFFAAWSRRGSFVADAAALLLLGAGAAVTACCGRPDLVTLYLPAFYLGCMARTHGRRLAAAFDRSRVGSGAGILFFLLLLLAPWAERNPIDVLLPLVLGMSAAAFGLVSLVAWGASRAAARPLLHPAARFAGRVSYSFYVWHDLVLYAFTRLLFAALPPALLAQWNLTVLAATFAITAGLSFGIAALSWRWVERPFVALARRLGRRLDSRTAARLPLAADAATAP